MEMEMRMEMKMEMKMKMEIKIKMEMEIKMKIETKGFCWGEEDGGDCVNGRNRIARWAVKLEGDDLWLSEGGI